MKKILYLLPLLFAVGCTTTGDSPDDNTDTFDREALLSSWVDHYISPGYEDYYSDQQALEVAIQEFVADPNSATLSASHAALRNAYVAWQRVSMYEIGRAEEVDYRRSMNTYPASADKIIEAITSEQYNLELISSINQQGLPAIDYLLHGTMTNEEARIDWYANEPAAGRYLLDVADRMTALTRDVRDYWSQPSNVASFVAASSNSATGSVDRLVNDIILYYERNLRAGKLGIPAGVFSDQALPDHVESLYDPTLSKVLLLESIDNLSAFLEGASALNGDVTSLYDYLDYLDQLRGSESLSASIRAQLQTIHAAVNGLAPDLSQQITSDNIAVLEVYNELQRLVPLLKIDMVQSMGINIDFVDTDGD